MTSKEKIVDEMLFSTWFNEKCAITIVEKKDGGLFSSSSIYSVELWIYEPPYNKVDENLQYIKILSSSSLEEAKKRAKELEKTLKSEEPNSFLDDYKKGIVEIKIEGNEVLEPDQYIRKYDIIARPISNEGAGLKQKALAKAAYIWQKDDRAWHYGIYLGNGQVAHYYGDDSGRGELATNDSWKRFLDGKEEVIIEHPFIPARKGKVILRSIAAGWIDLDSWYSLPNNNCEHNARSHVLGIKVSEQVNKILYKDLRKTLLLGATASTTSAYGRQVNNQLAAQVLQSTTTRPPRSWNN